MIETKELNGTYYARLTDEFKVSGDKLYDVGGVVLPLGTITIQETKAPDHYTTDVIKVTDSNNEVIATSNRPLFGQIRDDDRDGLASLAFGNDATYEDKIEKGGVAVQKFDLELKEAQAQGSAVLSGAKIEIINDNDGLVASDDGEVHAKGETVLTLITDAQGYATTDANALPVGDYIARETLAPAGFLLDRRNDGTVCNSVVLEQSFTVEAGQITELTDLENGIVDQVKRGGVKIQKFDFDSKLPESQGTPDLSDATFDIISLNTNPVTDESKKVYNNGEVVYTLTTDSNGIAETSDRALPVGHYKVVETKAPEGYFLWGIIEREFTITDDGEIVELKTYDTSISDRIMRGDLTFLKKDEDNKPMSGIPFEISLLDKNGNVKESHIAYTDDNGKLTTKNRFGVQHSTNTNKNDDLEVGSGSWENGIWFGKAPVDDSMGALPYGNYTVQELRCKANEKYDLISFDLTIHPDRMDDDDLTHYSSTPTDNNFLLDEGTLHDTLDRHDYTIRSLAWNTAVVNGAGDNRARLVSSEPGQAITDEVTWEFDNPKFTEYVIVSKLIDKSTGKPFVDASGKSFIIESELDTGGHSHGTVWVHFEDIDFTGLEGKTIVVFEYLYEAAAYAAGGAVNTLADDTDLENDKQTIYVSGLHTTAKDTNTGDSVAVASEKASLTDTVHYSNLNVGYEYRISGILMDKETGKAVLDSEGKEIRAEKTFYADKTEGTVDIIFEFDASLLKGKTIVVFEDLFFRDRLLTSHNDINDISQTVYFPEIHTSATDSSTKANVGNTLASPVEIKDEVSYKNLVPGKEYKIRGVLMDRETGEPFVQTTGISQTASGSAISAASMVTAEKTFIPEKSDGTIELTFLIASAESLKGKTVVVFEDLYHNDIKVTSHADIEDKDQTIYFPEIGTKASVDGKNEAVAGKDTKLIDTVTYKNLIPGKEYRIVGKLMVKETKEALKDATGAEITKELIFKPETSDGSIDMEFVFDSTELYDKTVVVFESIYFGETEIGAHADLEDAGQSVHFTKPEEPKTPKTPQTFDNSKTVPGGVFGVSALALSLVLLLRVLKRKKKIGRM